MVAVGVGVVVAVVVAVVVGVVVGVAVGVAVGVGMKTAEEVADYIADQIFYYDDEDLQILKELTAKALTAFASEQNKSLTESLHLETQIEEAIKRKARAEALEEAADIADEHNGCVSTKCFKNSNCPVQIGNEIRALKEKP